MSVSTDTGNLDLTALVEGGEKFLKRISELKDAKSAYESALANMNLGKAAQAARDEAVVILEAAKKKRDEDLASLDKEVTEARKSIAAWSETAKAEAASLKSEAIKMSDEAKTSLAAASSAKAGASKELSEAQARAQDIVAKASSQAEGIIKSAKDQADSLTKDLVYLKKETENSLAAAKKAEASFKAKLSAIQAAASVG